VFEPTLGAGHEEVDESQATRISPLDERLLAGVNVAAPNGTAPSQAIYVLTRRLDTDGREKRASRTDDLAKTSGRSLQCAVSGCRADQSQ